MGPPVSGSGWCGFASGSVWVCFSGVSGACRNELKGSGPGTPGSAGRKTWFRQKYLCEFTESEGAMFTREMVEAALDAGVEPI